MDDVQFVRDVIEDVAGIQYPEGCVPARAVPILTFHGKADASNHYLLREDFRPYWLMGVETAVDKWRQADGCSFANDDAALSAHVAMYRWSDCAGSSELQFYVIDNGGHTWPGSEAMSRNSQNVTNMDADASELIWEFFSRHRLR